MKINPYKYFMIKNHYYLLDFNSKEVHCKTIKILIGKNGNLRIMIMFSPLYFYPPKKWEIKICQ